MPIARTARAASLGIAAALSFALAAAAQAPPPAAGMPLAGRPMPPGAPPHDMRMGGRRAEHRARMIADWTQVLKLTPAQAQALQTAMAPPMRPDHPPAGARPPGMADDTMLQRLDRRQGRMAEHQGHMRERLAAMRAFYTSLSPDQQKTFDAVTRLSHGGMRGHHRGRGMGGRMGWGPTGEGGPGPRGEGGFGPDGGMRRGPPPQAGR